MIVYDLNSGHREYPGYDEIEDRRGGGRGRSRRSDGTYMGRCPICLCNVLFGWFSEGLQM